MIAIDGPAGSGKTTVARRLASALRLEYLDTGAMYRAVTFAALARGIDPADEDVVAGIARNVRLELSGDGTVVVDGIDATTQIRGPEVTRAVSTVAANPAVRGEMVERQRSWAAGRAGAVVEGRDVGTVVFPDAELKAYLTASAEVRAGRRHKEVADLDYESVAADMARRDTVDAERSLDPLRVADDAVVIDTTTLSVDEVVDDLLSRL